MSAINVDELIIRFDEIESLVAPEDADVVEREGLQSNTDLPAHRRASIIQICKITKRELTNIKERREAKEAQVDEIEEEPKRKLGRYMGIAGTYE